MWKNLSFRFGYSFSILVAKTGSQADVTCLPFFVDVMSYNVYHADVWSLGDADSLTCVSIELGNNYNNHTAVIKITTCYQNYNKTLVYHRMSTLAQTYFFQSDRDFLMSFPSWRRSNQSLLATSLPCFEWSTGRCGNNSAWRLAKILNSSIATTRVFGRFIQALLERTWQMDSTCNCNPCCMFTATI